MTPLLRESVYPPRIMAALAESGRREDARAQAARASATHCPWCGKPLTGTTCCGSEPWQMQDNHRTLQTSTGATEA